jgi:hypothetical protein
VDRAGRLDLGRPGLRGLAALVRIPVEVVEGAVAELVASETLAMEGDTVIVPHFVEAQAAQASAAERKRRERELRKSPESRA